MRILPGTSSDLLREGLEVLNLGLSKQQQDLLLRYLTLMQKWSRVYNLTAIRDPERMVSHHLLDSLAIVFHVRGQQVLDVGSGAGLPGIPLAVSRPDLSVTMLDSNQKKTAFIQQVIAELGLTNTKVVCARVEAWRPSGSFDVIVSRAYAELADFVLQTRHLLGPEGNWLAMKGQRPDAEIARLSGRFRIKSVSKLNVPTLDAERHLVSIEATQET